jgi:hypothetical protein
MPATPETSRVAAVLNQYVMTLPSNETKLRDRHRERASPEVKRF